ncbi:MarR family winged helix-turn-helix transcriptional regulator [Chryseobacterium wangxinyae]|uniref:MarR family winged helix-turn-helix transcriptional regulator n=1 Tax=Chryseobacterium sp. CY353 TaxID=2997334 RepID=UPI00226FE16F|nr:MarR family winged helix-turn-helix transcriptional regulator [Chryseobacterium sp. CY353]MCY0970474.1 MarR family winged helix-turn-helix transcriptional regulator [Chryseobacterium sp. CY353]
MNTNFIIDLLHEVKSYEDSEFYKPNGKVEDFRVWLNEKKYAEESPTKLFKNEDHAVSFTENDICKQIILLSRYSKLLIRKGLGEFPDLANEEFTYLYRLKDESSLTKTQLIEKNAHEKQTGTQIIKRLIEAGFVQEKGDEEDRRIKRLSLTEKGEEIFHHSVEKVNKTSKVLTGKLDVKEKKDLLSILKKLNEFHAHIYAESRNVSIEKIQELI